MLDWLRNKMHGDATKGFEPIEARLNTVRSEPSARLESGSPTWVFVAGYCGKRLDVLRSDNDGDLDQIKTANIRGQIQAIKDILDLPNPKGVDRWANNRQ